MKKQFLSLTLMLSFLIVNGQSNDKKINKIVLQEDKNVKITLHYFSKADLGDPEWMKIDIENKTNYAIKIMDANSALIEENQTASGEKYVDNGRRANKLELFPGFFDMPHSPGYGDGPIIEAKSSLMSGQCFTNYADFFESKNRPDKYKICALFLLDFNYSLQDQEISLTCKSKPFCFEWVKIPSVEEAKLVNRLREDILHPYTRKRVNSPVIRLLIEQEKIVNNIATEDLIQGVILRENCLNPTESTLLLAEMIRRNASPNEAITGNFKKRLVPNDGFSSDLTEELRLYWDNALLEALIHSDMPPGEAKRILEIHAKQWSSSAENKKKVYEYFASTLKFDKNESLRPDKMAEWIAQVKMMATSRDIDFIHYLKKYLDDTSEFTVKDWSKYEHYGVLPNDAKPAQLNTRVCDVAFVGLLIALDQFQVDAKIINGTMYFPVTPGNEILSSEAIQTLQDKNRLGNPDFTEMERVIKLTPELKEKVLKKIEAVTVKG